MRIGMIVTLAALWAGPALASGTTTFTIEGANPDGSAYGGTVTVTESPAAGVGKGERFIVVWNTGGDPVAGIGVVPEGDGKVLSIAYSVGGHPGIAVMTRGDGKVSGVWTIDDAAGLGTEIWTPVP